MFLFFRPCFWLWFLAGFVYAMHADAGIAVDDHDKLFAYQQHLNATRTTTAKWSGRDVAENSSSSGHTISQTSQLTLTSSMELFFFMISPGVLMLCKSLVFS